jgi:tRNA(fMet)-specific endonuclease VapC
MTTHSMSSDRLICHMRWSSDDRSLPYGDPEAEIYARIRSGLSAIGLPIGHYELMIAAISLTHRLTLVTHNTAEFSRVPGLSIVDWELP